MTQFFETTPIGPGTLIGNNVRLERMLGQGGMGSVWIAEHIGLETEVAVKFISAEIASEPEAVARFKREATAAAQLKSPHVVQVFDHGVTPHGGRRAKTMAFDPKRRLTALALAVALVLASRPGGAQSAGDRETARTLMKQGDAAYEAGDHAAALKAYETAHGIMHVPSTGVALARAQEKLGKLLEALDTALSVLRSPVAPSEPAVFTEARAAAQQLAEALEPRIPSLTVNLDGAPADQVQVTIDGAELPKNLVGVPRKLNPGKHAAIASAPGFHQARADIDLGEAASESLILRLEPSTGPTTESWPKAGGEPAPQDAEDARGPGVSPFVYAGFGVGAAGLVVGSVTGILSLSKVASARDDHCRDNLCSEAARDDIDSSKTLATVSNVAIAIGAVGVGVGVYGLLSSGGTAKTGRKKPRVEPLVGNYLGVRGVF